jgi:DNA-binding NarL/FixJ family response regulator
MTSGSIAVLIADDHALVRYMLKERLALEADIRVTAAVGSGEEAIRVAGLEPPEVAVLDIDMPGLSAFETAKIFRERFPRTRVIFLSAFVQDRYIERALKVQASGYLTKSEPPETVIQAIRRVMAGVTCFSADVRARLVVGAEGMCLAAPSTPIMRQELLTEREQDILRCLARGMPKKDVARKLNISVKTVDHHATHIMAKLDIHDRVELARFAIREGFIEP